MNSSPELSPDNPRPKPRAGSIEYLITEGLGYCCANFFWRHYGHLPSPLIAARLGVTADQIRRNRQWFREGRFPCTRSASCISSRLEA